MEIIKNEYPTEQVDLCSKGLVYPDSNILSQGFVNIKYPTAYHEDILTNQNYINKGIVVDEFLKSIIVDDIDFNSLHLGDKTSIIIASRILLYGAEYPVKLNCKHCSEENEMNINLSSLEDKIVEFDKLSKDNIYLFVTETGVKIKFQLMTQKINNDIEKELKFQKDLWKKQGKKEDSVLKRELSTRLKHMIVSINDESDKNKIALYLDNNLRSIESKALRDYITKINPDVDLTFVFNCNDCGKENSVRIPMTEQFFWPTT